MVVLSTIIQPGHVRFVIHVAKFDDPMTDECQGTKGFLA